MTDDEVETLRVAHGLIVDQIFEVKREMAALARRLADLDRDLAENERQWL